MDNTAFFKLNYGLYVLTAKDGEKDNGCIINTVMQVTDIPKRIAIAVNKENYTCDIISRTKVCNISVLTEDAPFVLFQRFGFQSGRKAEKFFGLNGVKRSANGVTYLTENACAYFSGNVAEEIDLGTHKMFVLDITEAENIGSGAPVSYSYYHKNIKPQPEKTEKKGWRCKICGYVYEGEELPEDFICPLCKHPASDFEKIE